MSFVTVSNGHDYMYVEPKPQTKKSLWRRIRETAEKIFVGIDDAVTLSSGRIGSMVSGIALMLIPLGVGAIQAEEVLAQKGYTPQQVVIELMTGQVSSRSSNMCGS